MSTVLEWLSEPRELAVAVLTGFDGSAPVEGGASLYVDASGAVAGAIAGGAVDAQIAREAATHPGEVRTYPISDEQAQQAGLSCGGIAHVLLAAVTDPDPHIAGLRARADGRAHVLARQLSGADAGATLYVDDDGVIGTLGAATGEAQDAARDLLGRGRNGERRLTTSGETELHLSARVPPPRLVIFGAIDFSVTVAAAAERLGYRVQVVEWRPGRAAARALSVLTDPDLLVGETLGPRDAVLVFTHDVELDVPAIRAAFAAGAGYVGALGSRRTTARRNAALEAAGVTGHVHAPCGLDLGASTAEETAISIMAEILAVRTARSAQPLASVRGSIQAR